MSISGKGKVVANVFVMTNDHGLRSNRNFMKLAKSYSSILQKILKDNIITLKNP